MIVKFRSASLLPVTQELIGDDTRIAMSLGRGSLYISKTAQFGTVKEQIISSANEMIALKYNLLGNDGTAVDVSNVKQTVDNMLSGDLTFSGSKTFTGKVKVIETDSNDLSSVANVAYVNSRIATVPFVVGPSSTAPCGLVDTDEGGSITEHAIKDMMALYFNNSSSNSRTSTSALVPNDGNLCLYGWLADTGDIDSSNAWVALEAKLNSIWTVVQLQPWQLGSRHSNLQYVTFNLPVAKDLELRVVTGFELNYKNSTYQGRNNSLVTNNVNNGTNIANAFVGYVIS